MFLPHPRVKVSIVGSLRDREVACSASDRQGSNFESFVWRTVLSQSSHHPQEVLLAQLSLYVHKRPIHFISFTILENLKVPPIFTTGDPTDVSNYQGSVEGEGQRAPLPLCYRFLKASVNFRKPTYFSKFYLLTSLSLHIVESCACPWIYANICHFCAKSCFCETEKNVFKVFTLKISTKY